MNYEQEAYRYGERIGREYHRVTPMETPKGAEEHLRDRYKYDQIKAVLRELAGFEHTRHSPATVSGEYHSDSFRKDPNHAQERLDETVIPAFWRGFRDGFTV